ncbi:hypothetical protein NMG29_11445 [Streptomyces cocklensis]|jgi:hypothetical protein|uniref:Uncharacterized protein n=1 Tax=Actinacidiphila cocklensis TaxID=887465 RepID=A0A9W4E4D9_9ACTN|nr:hypothetical protein [Actinacidiphila cocklensis]MDD1058819.1 hypothetical protein [Actinacidiphila cocklensis]WSX74981.1 hypothetical protein OH826_14435 [Streptomyces sp. NBC_00899]CAG6398945.1 conserved hypothetical protein [Actinacidiphila cocklensis]
MAIRKSTMQEQVAEAIAQINPGDRPIATIHTVTGPSPWLTNAIGLLAQAFVKYYFVTVTEQAVVFHKAGRMSARPKELVVAIPRQEAAALISDVKRKPLWSSLKFQLPGEAKPTRLNVARYWRPELDQWVAAATGTPVAAS